MTLTAQALDIPEVDVEEAINLHAPPLPAPSHPPPGLPPGLTRGNSSPFETFSRSGPRELLAPPWIPGSVSFPSTSGKAGGPPEASEQKIGSSFGEALGATGSTSLATDRIIPAIDGLRKAQDEDKTGSKGTPTSPRNSTHGDAGKPRWNLGGTLPRCLWQRAVPRHQTSRPPRQTLPAAHQVAGLYYESTGVIDCGPWVGGEESYTLLASDCATAKAEQIESWTGRVLFFTIFFHYFLAFISQGVGQKERKKKSCLVLRGSDRRKERKRERKERKKAREKKERKRQERTKERKKERNNTERS